MITQHNHTLEQSDTFPTTQASIRDDVLAGLLQDRKELPCKLFYDERGSELFEQICRLDEYYPTRTEIAILEEYRHAMAARLGPNCVLIEYGSGSSTKVRWLLDVLERPRAYVPIDISRAQILQAARTLRTIYPRLTVLPVCADYTSQLNLPLPTTSVGRRVAYYPGSTIGNFHPDQAQLFLRRIAATCGPRSGLLIGVDLKKDPEILHAAYNDRQGITAAFNLNLLLRLNRELGADFQIDQYRHYAFYNPDRGRIEMHLSSLVDQSVHLDEYHIDFRLGETIWTESSYKYRIDEWEALAWQAGYRLIEVWTDPLHYFSVQYLVVDA